MIHRPLLEADIVRPRTVDQARASSLDDFVTGPARIIRRKTLEGRLAFPCVFDIARARTLYVLDLDARQLRNAPFANIHARSAARAVMLVPWEAGPINRPLIDHDPLYVFSSGRCGSTLLHTILTSAGVHGVSEPDVGNALLSSAYRKYGILRPILHRATAIYVRDLVSALAEADGTLVVKLRSQFCAAAPALLNKSRERRTIFMIRRFESWAKSVTQMFSRVTPGYLLETYDLSLRCYAYLRQHSDCHLLHYEALVEQPHREMERLSEFLGRDLPNQAVDKAMGMHSQKGTRLERVSEKGAARWDLIGEEVRRRWKDSVSAEFCSQVLGGEQRP